jgi:hypothetical protein
MTFCNWRSLVHRRATDAAGTVGASGLAAAGVAGGTEGAVCAAGGGGDLAGRMKDGTG